MDTAEHARLGEENKARLRTLYESVVTGTPLNPTDIFADDVIIYEPALAPWGGTYRGFDGQKLLAAAQKGWMVNGKLEILALYADGPHVVSKIHVTMADGGKKLMLSEHVTYRDGKVIEMRVFVFDEQDAPAGELFAVAR